MPSAIVFNQEVALGLMWIKSSPVFHVIDTHTGFGAAAFINSESADAVWLTFEGIWTLPYMVPRQVSSRPGFYLYLRELEAILRDGLHPYQVLWCTES